MTEKAIVPHEAPIALRSQFAERGLSPEQARYQVQRISEVYKTVMSEGTDYGVIPGTPKPSLWKPGAEILGMVFELEPRIVSEDKTFDFERGFIKYDYHMQVGYTLPGGLFIVRGEGVGSCNSWEEKYRYRWVWPNELPPEVDRDSLVKRWVRTKTGRAPQYRLENPDPWSLDNTIKKQAKKRCFVDAILNATSASRIFTQDVEDLPPTLMQTVAEDNLETRGTDDAAVSPEPKTGPPEQKAALPHIEQAKALEELAYKMWSHIESKQARSMACGRWINQKFGKGWGSMTPDERSAVINALAFEVGEKKEVDDDD
jgi:hypothetical protein